MCGVEVEVRVAVEVVEVDAAVAVEFWNLEIGIRRKENMIINKTSENDKLTVAVEGRLDTTTAPQLEGELKNSLDDVKELVFDISKLEYISSAGLRVLLSAQKVMNKQGKMTVTGASESVMEIFEVTGFSEILNIE